jgi:hypothetical protein
MGLDRNPIWENYNDLTTAPAQMMVRGITQNWLVADGRTIDGTW